MLYKVLGKTTPTPIVSHPTEGGAASDPAVAICGRRYQDSISSLTPFLGCAKVGIDICLWGGENKEELFRCRAPRVRFATLDFVVERLQRRDFLAGM